MIMTKIHVISDLFLRFNRPSIEEETIPDVDLVVINGNLGHIKRGMLYVETLCQKYPDVPFIYNPGEVELYSLIPKYIGEIEEQLRTRRDNNVTWPKNLYYSQDPMTVIAKNGYMFDVLCVYGFPKIHDYTGDWGDTIWANSYVRNIAFDSDCTDKWYKPKETSNVMHGHVPEMATLEWINEQHANEHIKVKNWELNPKHRKLLITHLNPYKDSRFEGQIVSPYQIHLYNGVWIASNTQVKGVQFLGSRLYSNPGCGAARSNVIIVD